MKSVLSESDAAQSLSGQFDTVSKRVIQQNPEDWIRFTLGIPEAEGTMYESSVIQHFTEQGIEQGERKGVFESLVDVLESQFQHSEVQTLKPTLERIEELQYLRQLLREALQVTSLDEFRRILGLNGR